MCFELLFLAWVRTAPLGARRDEEGRSVNTWHCGGWFLQGPQNLALMATEHVRSPATG